MKTETAEKSIRLWIKRKNGTMVNSSFNVRPLSTKEARLALAEIRRSLAKATAFLESNDRKGLVAETEKLYEIAFEVKNFVRVGGNWKDVYANDSE